MSPAKELLQKLQDATHQRFWEAAPDSPTFKDVLVQYAIYHQKLNGNDLRVKLSKLFWDQIRAIGTPIIEEKTNGQCEVYFLFPRDKSTTEPDSQAKTPRCTKPRIASMLGSLAHGCHFCKSSNELFTALFSGYSSPSCTGLMSNLGVSICCSL
jgi:hypothetical protein